MSWDMQGEKKSKLCFSCMRSSSRAVCVLINKAVIWLEQLNAADGTLQHGILQ